MSNVNPTSESKMATKKIKPFHHGPHEQRTPCTRTVSPREQHEVLTRGFGIHDAKGRAVGARVRLYTVEYAATPESEQDRWAFTARALPGTYYVAKPQALRSGVPYGATQRDYEFRTEEDRAAWVEQYFADALKRAQKTHG